MAVSKGDPGASGGALHLALIGAAATVQRAGAAPVPLTRLDAALLAVLAIEGSISRQRLLPWLWPDQGTNSARNALRQRLFRLRRAVAADLVRGSEQLTLADTVTHDLGTDADDGAMRGELLGGFDYADCQAFDDWLSTQRRTLRQRWRAGNAERIATCEREARHADGAALAERILAAEPLDEAAVRLAMKLHYLADQRSAALAVFDRFTAALAADDAGVTPARETTELLATIRGAAAVVPARRREIPASVLRPPRLVGRGDVLRALHATWSGAQVFWLLGEAGLGKSRLIAEFAGPLIGDAQAPTTLVVAARPGDGGVPYASLGRALRALIERRPTLLERAERNELARVMPEVALIATARAAGAQLVLQRAIGSLLRDAWRDGVRALVFDDLHFADTASLEMLQALVCDDALTELRWGFAQRGAEGSTAIDALRGALEDTQRVVAVALEPLAAPQMAELIASLAVPGLHAATWAPALTRHTGGNPLYALETIKHLIVSGQTLAQGLGAADGAVTATRLPRPASVGQLIERRLRQLTPPALALARVAAVAGIDFHIELAQAVLDTRALALTDAWRELEGAQVLRGDAFAHDLVHEATLAGIPAPIAAHTHGEVAAWLEAHGGEPARVAAHWIAAGQAPRALAALHAAADAARHAMRRKEEAAFLERAARIEGEAGDQEAAYQSWRAMIDAVWVVDLTHISAALFDHLDAAATTPARRASALALRANWRQECGDLGEAKRLAQRAIELADHAGDESTAVDARQRLAHIHDWDGEHEAAVALLQPLLPWAAERASAYERAEFYCRLGIVLDNVERGREARVYHQHAITAARHVQAWNGVVTVLGNLAVSWATAGHMSRAIELLREAMQLAAAHDEARGCAASIPAEMYKCLRDCGHYTEALRWIEPALAAEPGMVTALLQSHVACGWMHLGQHARAHREIDSAMKTDTPDWMRAKALQMRARLACALGQRGAGAWLDEALQIARTQAGRRALRASIMLDHALTLEPVAALTAARDVIADGERHDLAGTALAGHIRAARFAADAQRADDAMTHARAARAISDDVAPNDLYPAERWQQAWRAYKLAGFDGEADDALRRGVSWVRTIARDHVPEPFRDSFLRANAVNQQMLRAASGSR